MADNKPTVYAIDFGTTNSLLAAVGPAGVEPPLALDESADDPSVFRSILHFSDSGQWRFGAEALASYVNEAVRGRFLRSLKRFLPLASFEQTLIGTRSVKLEELIGIFLREMRRRANAHYGVDVRRALLGRPARFSRDAAADALAERRLRAAAQFAGFEEIELCPEPLAAAYDFRSQLQQPKLVLVADFGGGTSDFSVVRLTSSATEVEVLALGGINVAGDAFDGALMRHRVARHFGAEVRYRVPFGSNLLSMPRPLLEALCSPAETCLLARRDVLGFLRDVRSGAQSDSDKRVIEQLLCLVEDVLGFQLFEAIEHTKRELSEHEIALFRFDYPGIELQDRVTLEEFQRYSEPQVQAILATLDETLADSGFGPADIDLVCCTGGTARVRAVAAGIHTRFGPEKLVWLRSLHSVIQGLAQRAALTV